MDRRHFLAASSAVLLAPEALAKSAPDDRWSKDFDSFIVNGLANTTTPGMAVAMLRGSRTILCRGYGYADVENARRVTPDTVFQIASVSKTVTATAMMMLWQDGAFQLDDPVAPHLDFGVRHPKFPHVPITFRHLFTHTSGISDAVYDGLDFASRPVPALRDFLAGYLSPGGRWYDPEKSYSALEPGTAWSYSNVGVALLGYIAGRVNPQPLDALTQARLFQPLGMRSTAWRYAGIPENTLALPYAFKDRHYRRLPRAAYPDWPAGLLCTSANDFAKFLAIYTQAGQASGHFLKAETIAAMFTPDRVLPHKAKPHFRQGLIWELAPLKNDQVALHSGGDPGSTTLAAIDRDQNTAALAFANRSPAEEMAQLKKEVVQRLLERASAA
ncbi:MAG TPA: serine hydrolase domain-containing protein [Rhizomicrobium sp.]